MIRFDKKSGTTRIGEQLGNAQAFRKLAQEKLKATTDAFQTQPGRLASHVRSIAAGIYEFAGGPELAQKRAENLNTDGTPTNLAPDWLDYTVLGAKLVGTTGLALTFGTIGEFGKGVEKVLGPKLTEKLAGSPADAPE